MESLCDGIKLLKCYCYEEVFGFVFRYILFLLLISVAVLLDFAFFDEPFFYRLTRIPAW